MIMPMNFKILLSTTEMASMTPSLSAKGEETQGQGLKEDQRMTTLAVITNADAIRGIFLIPPYILTLNKSIREGLHLAQ